MNQRLLQNLLESILREHVHLPYGMNLDLTNNWSSSCELSSSTCHSSCCFLHVQLASAGRLEVTCLATVVTNGFFMETLEAVCPFFSTVIHDMLICGFMNVSFS